MFLPSKGGNVVPTQAGARVDFSKKCALVAVETPDPPSKPDIIKAPNIDSAFEQLNVEFKFQLRRLDGSTSCEKLKIKSLDDFEEATIVEKSEVLREQKKRMNFLHEFQNELKHNPVFREELKTFLESDKREQFMEFLKGWAAQMKKPNSQFLQLLRS
ncbi:MAG: type VI secretion system contractile sheath small subunit [Saprospiraceae bacterium]|nr:type VI secretion system contractile sheath small subunit [Saprospiraceae bacterium]